MVLEDSLRRCGVQKPDKMGKLGKDGKGDDWEWGEGADEPIEAECDLENPESCESCE